MKMHPAIISHYSLMKMHPEIISHVARPGADAGFVDWGKRGHTASVDGVGVQVVAHTFLLGGSR